MPRLVGKTVRQMQLDRGRVGFVLKRINLEPGIPNPIEKPSTGPGVDWTEFKSKGKEK